jgi:hypothetical protein
MHDSYRYIEKGIIVKRLHLELGRKWKVIILHMYFVKRRVRIFHTKNLYGNDT